MTEIIENRVLQLKTKLFAELSQRPSYEVKKVEFGRKIITISIWKDMISENEVQIVVQAYKPWFFGLGKMGALGFRMNNSNESRDLEPEEIYEFI